MTLNENQQREFDKLVSIVQEDNRLEGIIDTLPSSKGSVDLAENEGELRADQDHATEQQALEILKTLLDDCRDDFVAALGSLDEKTRDSIHALITFSESDI